MDEGTIGLLLDTLKSLRAEIAQIRSNHAALYLETEKQIAALSQRVALLEARSSKKHKTGALFTGIAGVVAALVRVVERLG